MSWTVVIRPEVEQDVSEAAAWYESQQEGLGEKFREEVIRVFDALALNPLIYCERHPRKEICWRYQSFFPTA
jgi:hypothetical protein